jgi:REP element-mobilizing transposase RayT
VEDDPDVEAASRRFRPRENVEANYFDPAAPLAILEANLPHWRQEFATYFVTFRTADSLPQEKLRRWESERDEWLRSHPEPLTPDQELNYQRLFSERLQRWLDAGYGECLMARPDVRQIVVQALGHFDGTRYRLHTWVVMPNHAHVVVTPLVEYKLSDILQSWKSFTSKAINKLLGRTGMLWQKESFDHIVRSADSLEQIYAYILANPERLQPGTFTLSPNLKTRRAASK